MRSKKAGIDRIAAHVDDTGIWQRQMDKAGIFEVLRQLVDDPLHGRGTVFIKSM
jgi:hypothetical protein